jgi:hypothetical protein
LISSKARRSRLATFFAPAAGAGVAGAETTRVALDELMRGGVVMRGLLAEAAGGIAPLAIIRAIGRGEFVCATATLAVNIRLAIRISAERRPVVIN